MENKEEFINAKQAREAVELAFERKYNTLVENVYTKIKDESYNGYSHIYYDFTIPEFAYLKRLTERLESDGYKVEECNNFLYIEW